MNKIFYDNKYISTNNKYSKLYCDPMYIGRHDISSLPCVLSTTTDSFGGCRRVNHYTATPGKFPKLEGYSRELVKQLTDDLHYDNHILYKKCEIWIPKENPNVDYINTVRFSVSINHETKKCWITIVFTTDLSIQEDEPILIPQKLESEESFIPLRVRKPVPIADKMEEDLLDIDADEDPKTFPTVKVFHVARTGVIYK